MSGYANPPKPVRMTLEAVLIFMGKKASEWKEIKKQTAKMTFLTDVLEFDTDKVKAKTRQLVIDKYLNNEFMSDEKVKKASKAALGLASWLKAQVRYK